MIPDMSFSVGNIIRLAANMTLDTAGDLKNIFDVSLNFIPAIAQSLIKDDLLEYVEYVYHYVKQDMSAKVQFDSIDLFNRTEFVNEGDYPWPTYIVGDSVGDLLPAGAAALCTAYTAVPRKRGYKYFGGLTEGVNQDDRLTSGFLTNLGYTAGRWINQYTATNGTEIQAVVVSKAAPHAAHFATSYLINNIWSYQRRRKKGVGS